MSPPPDLAGLAVVLTASCNLRCAYCYQNAKRGQAASWETVCAALDLVRGVRGPDLRLLFTGGEPLLEFDLLRRAVDRVESIRPPGLQVRYELVTNGTRLGDPEAVFLAAHGFAVQIGFDGVPAAQDVRAPGTAAVIDALLDRLRRVHPAFFRQFVSVAVTVTPATVRHLADSVEHLLAVDVAEILIAPAFTHQPDWDDAGLPELRRQFARIFRVSLERYRRTREVPLQLFRKGLARRPRRVRSLPMCPVADRRHLVVDVDGQVYGCVAFAESYQRFPSAFLEARMARLRMGPIRAPDLAGRLAAFQAAARSSDILAAKGEKYSSYRRCADCRHLLSCAICPLAIGHEAGNDDPRRVPDFPCAFTQVAQTYRARFPRQPTVADLARGRVSPPAAVRRLLARRGAPGPAGPSGPAP
jgi:sulfatase maturation enzyme AslB (radical SAM superfamily)